MTTNYGKTFFSEERAKAFADYLETQNCEDIHIWGGMDAFGQHTFTVKWNYWGN